MQGKKKNKVVLKGKTEEDERMEIAMMQANCQAAIKLAGDEDGSMKREIEELEKRKKPVGKGGYPDRTKLSGAMGTVTSDVGMFIECLDYLEGGECKE